MTFIFTTVHRTASLGNLGTSAAGVPGPLSMDVVAPITDDAAAGTNSTERDIDGLSSVVNSNALVAALFMTAELVLFIEVDATDFDEWRKRVVFYSATAAALMHSLTVFIAAETGFILGNINRLEPSQKTIELNHFRSSWIGRRVEPWSGFTYIWGIVCGMVAHFFTIDAHYGLLEADIVAGVVTLVYICIGAGAWWGVGSYVGQMHKRVAKRATRDPTRLPRSDSSGHFDHRGRRLRA